MEAAHDGQLAGFEQVFPAIREGPDQAFAGAFLGNVESRRPDAEIAYH